LEDLPARPAKWPPAWQDRLKLQSFVSFSSHLVMVFLLTMACPSLICGELGGSTATDPSAPAAFRITGGF